MAKTTTRPTVRIHNTETNEVIDREMTNDEFSAYEADKAAQAAKQAEAEAKANARQAILDRLGLSAEEAKILLG
jgi:acyl-CoA reductase-like NAD-dependent aldehyde dehydrogenase